MRTAAFWTDTRSSLRDLAALVAFRRATIRGRSRKVVAAVGVAVVGTTIAVVVIPAYAAGSATSRDGWHDALPVLAAAFLVMAAGAAIITGGGRELVTHDQAVAFPVAPATDHLGALAMAPLNIAWVLQAWTLLGVTAYVAGPIGALSGPPLVLLWLALATAVGQSAGWAIEVIRRGPSGVLISRLVLSGLGMLGGAVVALGIADPVVAPARPVFDEAIDPGWGWLPWVIGLALLTLLAVVAGVPLARAALRRPQREEHRLESSHYSPRPFPVGAGDWRDDLRLLLRVDRASVFRSVPLRRGLLVLTLLPGLGGIFYTVDWSDLMLFPGLVASGVVLLFGVNAWSLDGHGILWRESLPISTRLAFLARTGVLAQLMVVAIAIAILPGVVHVGMPNRAQSLCLAAASGVALVQVLAAAARWSLHHPYAVDLLSARATPAPPLVMVGYSARLAVPTTFTGLIFGGLSGVDSPLWPLGLFTLLCLGWSSARLWRTARQWDRPQARAAVVAAVAG